MFRMWPDLWDSDQRMSLRQPLLLNPNLPVEMRELGDRRYAPLALKERFRLRPLRGCHFASELGEKAAREAKRSVQYSPIGARPQHLAVARLPKSRSGRQPVVREY